MEMAEEEITENLSSLSIQMPKPVNHSKPIVKGWSELFGSLTPPAASNGPSRASTRPSSAISVVSFGDEGRRICAATPNNPNLEEKFVHQFPASVQHRPIVNYGNRCYMIAVLQCLLHTNPFVNYFAGYLFRLELYFMAMETGKFPLLGALDEFIREFTFRSAAAAAATSAVSGDFIEEIFSILKGGGFSVAGFDAQEDAEEFLTAFLDALSHELNALRQHFPFELPVMTCGGEGFGISDDFPRIDSLTDDGEWLEMGSKRKVATTRRTPIAQTPVSVLFAGSFKSLYRSPGLRPSITFEPFMILSLAIAGDEIDGLEAALKSTLQRETLEDRGGASKQLSFASLPPVLIIQLKRFIYCQSHSKRKTSFDSFELHKVTKPLKIPANLEIPLNDSPTSMEPFKLFAAANHHGKSMNGGHYTATIRLEAEAQEGEGGWLCFDDDAKPEKITLKETRTMLNHNSAAYLLFYQRTQKEK